MSLADNVRSEEERVLSELSYGNIRVIVTDKHLVVYDGLTVSKFDPSRITGISIEYSLLEFVFGLVLLLIGGVTLIKGLGLIESIMFLIFAAIFIMFGYMFRYTLVIHLTGSSIKVRGGGKILKFARQLETLRKPVS